jgi:SAM-dependent methyltransferase
MTWATLSRAIAKTTSSMRERGVFQTTVAALTFFKRHSFPNREQYDRDHGVNTGGTHALWSLVDDPDSVAGCYPYHAVDDTDVDAALGRLGKDLSQFMFIDIGCGKGKALLVAASRFRTVIGIEIVPALVAIARQNLAKLKIRNALLFEMDARRFPFARVPTVVFLCNPFGREIMGKVVANMLSVDTEQYVIYVVPAENAVFAESGHFEKLDEWRGYRSGDVITIWKRTKR